MKRNQTGEFYLAEDLIRHELEPAYYHSPYLDAKVSLPSTR
jgi:hypothetical protein